MLYEPAVLEARIDHLTVTGHLHTPDDETPSETLQIAQEYVLALQAMQPPTRVVLYLKAKNLIEHRIAELTGWAQSYVSYLYLASLPRLKLQLACLQADWTVAITWTKQRQGGDYSAALLAKINNNSLSQGAIAKLAGRGQPAVSNYFKDLDKVLPPHLKALRDAWGTTMPQEIETPKHLLEEADKWIQALSKKKIHYRSKAKPQ